MRNIKLTDPRLARKLEHEKRIKQKAAEKAALKKQKTEEKRLRQSEARTLRASERSITPQRRERARLLRAAKEAEYKRYVEDFKAKKKAKE